MKNFLSDIDDDVVQTIRRLGLTRKGVQKTWAWYSSLFNYNFEEVVDFVSKYMMNKNDMEDSLNENKDDVIQTRRLQDPNKYFKKDQTKKKWLSS